MSGAAVSPGAGAPAIRRELAGETPPERENVYGHRKRLAFIAACLDGHRARGGPAQPPPRVLDFGCGTGVMITRPLARLGYEVTGLDVDEASIDQARRLNTAPRLANLAYVAGRLEEQSWEGRFDAIVAAEVLEHLDDPPAMIALLKRCLKDEGLLILTVPNGYGSFEADHYVYEHLARIPGFWRVESACHRLRGMIAGLAGRREELAAMAGEEDRPENLATLNDNSPHCQRFTYGRVVRLVEAQGFRLTASGRSAVWSGPIAHTLLRDSDRLIRLNCALADRLPAWLASGHFFCFRAPTRRPAVPARSAGASGSD